MLAFRQSELPAQRALTIESLSCTELQVEAHDLSLEHQKQTARANAKMKAPRSNMTIRMLSTCCDHDPCTPCASRSNSCTDWPEDATWVTLLGAANRNDLVPTKRVHIRAHATTFRKAGAERRCLVWNGSKTSVRDVNMASVQFPRRQRLATRFD